MITKTTKEKLKGSEHLGANDVIQLPQERVVNYGDQGNDPVEAQKLLPDEFTNPNLLVTFKNKEGHKFKRTLRE